MSHEPDGGCMGRNCKLYICAIKRTAAGQLTELNVKHASPYQIRRCVNSLTSLMPMRRGGATSFGAAPGREDGAQRQRRTRAEHKAEMFRQVFPPPGSRIRPISYCTDGQADVRGPHCAHPSLHSPCFHLRPTFLPSSAFNLRASGTPTLSPPCRRR